MGPRRSLGPLVTRADRPCPLPVGTDRLVDECIRIYVFVRQVVSRQPSWAVLDQELGAGAVGYELVPEPHSDAARRRLDKGSWGHVHSGSIGRRPQAEIRVIRMCTPAPAGAGRPDRLVNRGDARTCGYLL